MISVDLICGHLGSGKTTFIIKYAKFLEKQGYKVGIIENDFGAINIDRMLLNSIENENIIVEQIANGCACDWKRRFRTKLISIYMQGYNKILVEPSGIFDIDDFFDTLADDTIMQFYEAGNVIHILSDFKDKSEESLYLMTIELSSSGSIIANSNYNLDLINKYLAKYDCNRVLNESNIIRSSIDDLSDLDLNKILNTKNRYEEHLKLFFNKENAYNSLYYMNNDGITINTIKNVFMDEKCGNVERIKGFFCENNKWYLLNATKDNYYYKETNDYQDVIIVIGDNLNKELIDKYMEGYNGK